MLQRNRTEAKVIVAKCYNTELVTNNNIGNIS
uniref:Uncharacterized protein n=1 Tax=Arundo donax TaxID=35708 RepID=A0A0A9AIZ3_ARUDO